MPLAPLARYPLPPAYQAKSPPLPLHDTQKIALIAIFICIYAKNVVPLCPKAQRWGLEGGRCLLSESQLV